jgi:hypothetical protein
MGKSNSTKLKRAYSKYQKKKINKSFLLKIFSAFMPEIVFRTTKLEGESVKRKTVNALFS